MIILPPMEAFIAIGALIAFLLMLRAALRRDKKEQIWRDKEAQRFIAGRAARLDAKYGCAPEPSITFRNPFDDVSLPTDARFQVAGTGAFFPENFYTNQDLTLMEPGAVWEYDPRKVTLEDLQCVSCGAPKHQRRCAYCGR